MKAWQAALLSSLLLLPAEALAEQEDASGAPLPSPELLEGPPKAAPPVSMHPRIVLRDELGEPVITSAEPVSPETSCAGCHDVAWINAHSYHGMLGSDERMPLGKARTGRPWDFSPGVYGRWDPLSYLVAPFSNEDPEALSRWLRHESWRHVGGGPGEGRVERNCFLCHVQGADNQARIATTEAGHFRFAATATLRSTGLVTGQLDTWQWNAERFAEGSGGGAREGWSARPQCVRIFSITWRWAGAVAYARTSRRSSFCLS